MEPQGPPAKLQQHHIRQRTGTEASRDRQVEAPPESALLPLLFEFVHGERRKALLRASAAAPVAHEQVTVLDPDLLRNAIGSRDPQQRTLPVFVTDAEPRP